jgi:hypothetical protein
MCLQAVLISVGLSLENLYTFYANRTLHRTRNHTRLKGLLVSQKVYAPHARHLFQYFNIFPNVYILSFDLAKIFR